MMDYLDPAQRSNLMSRVKNRDTKIEIAIRSMLHRKGFRFRKNVKALPGKPDIVLAKYKTVIFIHGCFWHGHRGCSRSKLPETRTGFWSEKIGGNVFRDQENITRLQHAGWRVIIIWQCEISNSVKRTERLEQLVNDITS